MMEQLVDTNRSLPDLGSIQEMVVAKRFDDALTDLAEIFRAEPDNPDALYMAAVCCRYTHDFKSALEHIGKLKTISPEHGRAHQEEGHTYRDMGHPDDALLAYSRACRFNPALTASWRGQLEILRRKGLDRQAAQVTAQIEALQALPRPLLAAHAASFFARCLTTSRGCGCSPTSVCALAYSKTPSSCSKVR
jgi:tetratricopeptide (TPR) repeat protein